jgi:hypothetical protein
MLEANSKRPTRERLTARRLFELLRGEGYEGAYDSVQRHVREWGRQRSQQGPVFIPLWFAPGEAFQFDWSHEVVVLGGVTTTVKVAHIRLCHSRMFLVRAYPRETQEMVFDAHGARGVEEQLGALRSQPLQRRGQGGAARSYASTPIGSSSGARARSSASTPAVSAAVRLLTIPGITCRCWPSSPVRLGMATRSAIGTCRRPWRRSLAGSPATAIVSSSIS